MNHKFFPFNFHDADLRIKGFPNNILCHDLRSSRVPDPAVLHKEETIPQIERLIQIVQRGQNGDTPLCGSTAGFVDDQLLICQIQVSGRLVKNEQTRFLGQGTGDGDLLPLAAGELLHIARGIVFQFHIPKNRLHRGAVAAPGFVSEVGHAAHQHRVIDTQGTEVNALRHIGDPAGPLPAVHPLKIRTVKAEASALRRLDAEDVFEQSRLA